MSICSLGRTEPIFRKTSTGSLLPVSLSLPWVIWNLPVTRACMKMWLVRETPIAMEQSPLSISIIPTTKPEVLNEVNKRPNDEAYKLVNDVRKRVGLSELPKNMNYDEFLEAVLRERALELGFEEVRWFDLVRRGRENDFRKQLYGLRSRGNDQHNPTAFTFEKVCWMTGHGETPGIPNGIWLRYLKTKSTRDME